MDELETFLYHVVPQNQWESRFDGTRYDTPDRPETGFIHLSYRHQIKATVTRHFLDRTDLLVLKVDPRRLPALQCEDLYGHGEFPHHYGPIDADAIVDKRPWIGADPFGN
jgi:uncharacterized protein (DUF952 family)